MNDVYDRTALDGSISQLESVTANFAQRFIQDGKVRQSYIEQTRQLAQEYRARVASGALSADDAARQVQSIRNDILEAQRLRSTDIGRAKAINLKKVGLSLADLTEKYAKDKFGKPFTSLASNQQNLVYLEIIDSAGRQRPSVNAAAMRYTALGRGLVFVSVGAAIYNIASAEDKGKAVARRGGIGGGFAGGLLAVRWLGWRAALVRPSALRWACSLAAPWARWVPIFRSGGFSDDAPNVKGFPGGASPPG